MTKQLSKIEHWLQKYELYAKQITNEVQTNLCMWCVMCNGDVLVWTLMLTSSLWFLCSDQWCSWEHLELALLHPPHHHRILLHAQPGAGCPVRVSHLGSFQACLELGHLIFHDCKSWFDNYQITCIMLDYDFLFFTKKRDQKENSSFWPEILAKSDFWNATCIADGLEL